MDFPEVSGAVTGPEHQGGVAAGAAQRTYDLRASLEAIVSEAERASEQLVAESRATAAATTREADEHAEEILEQARTAADVIRSRAETEVEDYRRRVRTELVEQVRAELRDQNRLELAAVRAQSQAVIGDLEASVRILGVSMESAVANIAEMLSALEQLRSHTVDPMPQLQSQAPARPQSPLDPTQEIGALEEQPDESVFGVAHAPMERVDDPLSAPAFEDNDSGSEHVDAGPEEERAPMTASEAFLQANSFEVDSAGVAEPQDDPLGSVDHEVPEDADADQVKPLGWLFRSPD